MSQSECFFAKKVVVNGIRFLNALWLPNFADILAKKMNEIIDVVMVELDDTTKMYAICKTYAGVTYDDHYGCYRVDMNSLQNELSLISIHEFLSKHYYPVKIQHIQKKYIFRCKQY